MRATLQNTNYSDFIQKHKCDYGFIPNIHCVFSQRIRRGEWYIFLSFSDYLQIIAVLNKKNPNNIIINKKNFTEYLKRSNLYITQTIANVENTFSFGESVQILDTDSQFIDSKCYIKYRLYHIIH